MIIESFIHSVLLESTQFDSLKIPHGWASAKYWVSVFDKQLNRRANTPSEIEIEAAILDDAPIKYLVKKENNIVGAISYGIKDEFVEVTHLGSLSAGVGTFLMHKAISYAKRMKLELSLESSAEAIGFYKKLGLTQVGERGFVLPYELRESRLNENLEDNQTKTVVSYIFNNIVKNFDMSKERKWIQLPASLLGNVGKNIDEMKLHLMYGHYAYRMIGQVSYSKSGKLNVMFDISIPVQKMKTENYEEIYRRLYSTVRHELEHVRQFSKERIDLSLPKFSGHDKEDKHDIAYFTSPHELEAYTTEIYKNAVKSRRKFIDILDEFIKDRDGPLAMSSPNVRTLVKQSIVNFAKNRYPASQL